MTKFSTILEAPSVTLAACERYDYVLVGTPFEGRVVRRIEVSLSDIPALIKALQSLTPAMVSVCPNCDGTYKYCDVCHGDGTK